MTITLVKEQRNVFGTRLPMRLIFTDKWYTVVFLEEKKKWYWQVFVSYDLFSKIMKSNKCFLFTNKNNDVKIIENGEAEKIEMLLAQLLVYNDLLRCYWDDNYNSLVINSVNELIGKTKYYCLKNMDDYRYIMVCYLGI